MNSKYLNKNELKYFNNILKDINIINKINNINEKNKIMKNDEIKIENKEILIKNIDEKILKKTQIENIDETFKKNLLDIMTLDDYNKIKNDVFFNISNKNIININFERIKNYIKNRYVKLNIEEFIPIIKYIIEKKQLDNVDNLNEKLLIDINNIYDEYDKKLLYYNTQNDKLRIIYSEDTNKKYVKEVNKELLKLYNDNYTKIDESINNIEKEKNDFKFKIEKDTKDKKLDKAQLDIIFEYLKTLFNNLKNMKLVDYISDYENNKIIVLKKIYGENVNKGVTKLDEVFKKIQYKKMVNEVFRKIDEASQQKKIDENRAILVKNFLNNILNELEKAYKQNDPIIIQQLENNFENSVEKFNKDIEEVNNSEYNEGSTEAQTEQSIPIIGEQFIQTKKDERLDNLRNYIKKYKNMIFVIDSKNPEILNISMAKDIYNTLDKIYLINDFDEAKNKINELYKKTVNGEAKKYPVQLREYIIKEYSGYIKYDDFPK